MMTKLKITLICLVLSTPSFADDLSLGIIVGQSSNDLATDLCDDLASTPIPTPVTFNGQIDITCSADNTDSAIGINLSYNFTDVWGMEVGYIDLGKQSISVSFLVSEVGFIPFRDATAFDLEASAIYLAGTATWDFANNWSITGRLGTSNTDVKLIARDVDLSESDDESAAMGGVSLDYQFSEQWSAQIRYDYFNTEPDFSSTSLGVKYRF